MTLQGVLLRITDARKFLHRETCSRPADSFPCRGCPSVWAVAGALDALDADPRDARGARRALHDAVCASGCTDDDHANRTQAVVAAALRRFHASERAA